jgi:uncharacterized protein
MSDVEQRRARTLEMLKGAREFRTFDVVPELRSAGDGTLALRGYASRFNNWYDVGDPARGGFRERVRPGSFTRTLGEQPDVSLVLDHGRSGSGLPLARTTAGNLRLVQDDAGLAVDASPLDPDDPDVALIAAKMRANLISGMSFAFMVTGDSWSSDRSERTITGVGLHRGDVSLAVHPANELAHAELVARSATAPGPRRLPDLTTCRRERLAVLRSNSRRSA